MKNETIHIKSTITGDKNNLNGVSQTSQSGKPDHFDLDAIDPFLSESCFVHHSGRQFSCVYGACKRQNSCFTNELLHENLEFHALKSHPEDRLIWCEDTFPDITKFCSHQKLVLPQDYRISFNHRYIREDGSVSQFLHEGALTFSKENPVPALNLFLFTEIGDIKTDETIVLSIFRHTDNRYEKVFNTVYTSNIDSVLTARELEILKLCQEGLSSKMIAGRLNLSIHTVKNHKRKCMEKTLTHNISELLYTCIQNHWL